MKSANFIFNKPETLELAINLLAESQGMGKPLAGGQSLGPMMNMRLAQPESLIDITALAELAQTEEAERDITIGASITHAQIEDGLVADPAGGLLRRVAAGIAYRAVRNKGTLGGSLVHADPAADWINLMPLLNATMLVAGPQGKREIDAVNWMIGTFTSALEENEILVAIRIPKLSSDARRSYYKIVRKPGEFSEATAGFLIDAPRNICNALIGATDGPPVYLSEAKELIGELKSGQAGSLTSAALISAGLEPDTHAYRLHEVAMLRAAALLDTKEGEMQ